MSSSEPVTSKPIPRRSGWRSLLIGLVLGAVTGFLSHRLSLELFTFGLMPVPTIFALACFVLVKWQLTTKGEKHLIYVGAMFPIYFIAAFGAATLKETMPFFAFTMMGGLGAVLVFALMTLTLGLKKPYLFILAVVVILIGLGVLEHQLDLLTGERDAVVAPDEPSRWDEPIQNLYTAIYAYWQAIMLGFLSLQLYLEKLRRQKPAA